MRFSEKQENMAQEKGQKKTAEIGSLKYGGL